ncbi:MAG: putative rane protein [Frankiales bacterium]|nr:putative rane protein [Frankiales bacterium]
MQFLHPKWLALYVFAVVASVVMIKLGHWQWTAAHRHHGDIQNYAYAFQWWAFSGFTWLMTWRLIRDRLRVSAAATARAEAAAAGVELPPPPTPAPSRYQAYQMPTRTPDDDDPERIRFNAYLAQLNAADAVDASRATREEEQGAS